MKNIENLGNKSLKVWCVKHASKLDNHGNISNLVSNAEILFKFINSESTCSSEPEQKNEKISEKAQEVEKPTKDEILLDKIQLLARSDNLNKKLKTESLKVYADKEGIITADDGTAETQVLTKITDSINKGISEYEQKERHSRIKQTQKDAKLKDKKYLMDIPTNKQRDEVRIGLEFLPAKSSNYTKVDNNSKDKLADIYLNEILRPIGETKELKKIKTKVKKSKKKSKAKKK